MSESKTKPPGLLSKPAPKADGLDGAPNFPVRRRWISSSSSALRRKNMLSIRIKQGQAQGYAIPHRTEK